MNITNVAVTPVHVAFEEVNRQSCCPRGVRVTGTEIVGLIPKSVLLDAGRYFYVNNSARWVFRNKKLFVWLFCRWDWMMVKPFDVDNKVIEYMLDKKEEEIGRQKCDRFIL